ncbi:MAG: ABC transporter substrate-binding protein [Proteobacteria bacterium]|nr:ABC transporter substrate-binding protein [Pseudomonadota bacterium]
MKAGSNTWTRRVLSCLVCALTMGGAAAQSNDVRVARQYGIAYIPLMIMQDQQLIEKHAAQLGLPGVKVTWQQFTGGAVMNDALLSGNLNFAVAGPPPFLTMWARTQGTANQVLGVASLNTMPMYLMTRNPAVKSIRDFTDKDKIVVSGVKVSSQAVVLQMAAAKEWGMKEYDRLDRLTVAMPLSDSMALMLSGKGEVTADFTVPPFSFREAKAGMKPVLDTFTVMGGPSSTNVIYVTKKYYDANPKMVEAFIAALREAQQTIAGDKAAAAATYLKLSGDKETQANVVEMLNDPKVEFSDIPRGIMAYANFLYSSGAIKSKPARWQDAFVPELHAKPGD